MRSKINAVAATLPSGMDDRRDELTRIAGVVYLSDAAVIARELRDVMREIERDAGPGGSPAPISFPQAKDARRHLYQLETALQGEGL